MNPLTNVKNITKLNEIELSKNTKKSWHDMYKESAWIFIGGLPYGLTEGDILAVFSQYGEIVNINLVRDKKTGKTKGFCFLCYANQKSTVLAVDNFNGIKLCNRTIRVDHVANYKPPKEDEKDDELTKMLKSEGCAPKLIQMNESYSADNSKPEKKKKVKKEKKGKKKKKKKEHKSDESDSDHVKKMKIKEEKHDSGYDKYDTSSKISITEKELHQEKSNEKSLGEHFVHEKHRSAVSEKYHKSRSCERNMQSRSNSSDEERSRYKKPQESEATTRHDERSVGERKWYKRYSSSSSSDDSSDSSSSMDSIRYQNNRKRQENKPYSHKKIDKSDCNNTKYEYSSSESSKRHKSQSKKCETDNYESRSEKSTSEHRSKHENRHKTESSDENSRKNRHSYSEDKWYSEHKSKSKYKSESYTRHSSSYKKDKGDKR